MNSSLKETLKDNCTLTNATDGLIFEETLTNNCTITNETNSGESRCVNRDNSTITKKTNSESTSSFVNRAECTRNTTEPLVDDNDKLDKLLRMTSIISNQLQDLQRTVDEMEKRGNPQRWNYFKNTCTCSSLEAVEQLNNYLLEKENEQEFIKYIQSIGGRHSKDRVNRIMSALFTNGLGQKCSWLGQRNNIKASCFKCLEITKDSLLSIMDGFEFEKHAAEWFRLSRLRLSRENK
ncbi:unnamed protein product [Psylliodes chrysocephalus]|uniref:DUF4806 domain-containing protein n=1 Tax=Psylliodes chrysocephalus TaxID=3402493 RepID=A0A9P0CWB0_9CUCU|nr:unnamed protein product [Psylliodes chrysocephala]